MLANTFLPFAFQTLAGTFQTLANTCSNIYLSKQERNNSGTCSHFLAPSWRLIAPSLRLLAPSWRLPTIFWHLLTLSRHLLTPSWHRSLMSRDSESLGKSNGKKWSKIWTFLFGSGLKSPRKKKLFFCWFCLTKHVGNHASRWMRDLWSKGISQILAYH